MVLNAKQRFFSDGFGLWIAATDSIILVLLIYEWTNFGKLSRILLSDTRMAHLLLALPNNFDSL